MYSKTKTWSTTGTSSPINEKEVYSQCDLKFVYMDKRNFVELIKKPTSCMPVINTGVFKNVYLGGYYVGTVAGVNQPDNGDTPMDTNQSGSSDISPQCANSRTFCPMHELYKTHNRRIPPNTIELTAEIFLLVSFAPTSLHSEVSWFLNSSLVMSELNLRFGGFQ